MENVSSKKYALKLFVCGMTPQSEMAVTNVCKLFEHNRSVGFDLQIIDVLERPDIAEKERIVATPTLVREQPLPREVMIGDLSQKQTLRNFLGLDGRDGDGDRSGRKRGDAK